MTKEEVDKNVEESLDERIEILNETPLRHVFARIRVLFEADGKLLVPFGEFESFDAPNFVLQEAVLGKGMRDMLYESGKSCLSPKIIKGFGLPANAQVAGVIFSTEMLYATKITVGKDKKVKGYPFLVVAGQSSNGYCKTVAKPLLVDEDNNKFCNSEVVVQDKMNTVIKKVEKAKPFMQPFFDGIGKGESKAKAFVIFKDD